MTAQIKPTIAMMDTPGLVPFVKSYIIASAFAQTKRQQINEIKQRILDTAKYYIAIEKHPRRGERVTDPEYDWLMDDTEFADYLAEVNKQAVEQGVKPQEMPYENCPALVAENNQRLAENLLIEQSGKLFGVTNHKLLCSPNGLEKRQQWIDLVCQLVLSAHPEITEKTILN